MKIPTYTRAYLRQPGTQDIDFNGLSDETVFVEKEAYDKKLEEAIDKICYCKFVHEGEYCDEEICKNQLLKKELEL